MFSKRWSDLVARIDDAGHDGLAIMPGPNLLYMTGMRMGISERPTLCAVTKEGQVTFLMPKLEAPKGHALVRRLRDAGVDLDFQVISFSDEEGPSNAFLTVFEGTGRNWAFEYRSMRLLELSLVSAAIPGLGWSDAGEIMRNMRMIKSEEELARMKKACELTELGADIARKMLAPGIRAVEIAEEIGKQLKARGAQAVGMSLATGADSALPHAGTSTSPVALGDVAWLDITVSVDGYWGDLTRAYAIGVVSPELQRIYRVVLEANEAARTQATPGMTGAQVDALARDVIESYGYGDYFVHRTGHGLGLEVHEDPYIVASNHEPLPIGSTFTIEPGIYLPGKGGIRIEDDVVMTEDGCHSLTTYPRNLLDYEPKLVV